MDNATELGTIIEWANGSKAMYDQIKEYLTVKGTPRTVRTVWGTTNPFNEPNIIVQDDLLREAIEHYRSMHAANYKWMQAVTNSNDILDTKRTSKGSKPRKGRRPVVPNMYNYKQVLEGLPH